MLEDILLERAAMQRAAGHLSMLVRCTASSVERDTLVSRSAQLKHPVARKLGVTLPSRHGA